MGCKEAGDTEDGGGDAPDEAGLGGVGGDDVGMQAAKSADDLQEAE